MHTESLPATPLPPLLVTPKVPQVVRIYAMIIMLLNSVTAIKLLANFAVVAITSRTWTLKMYGPASSFHLVFLVIALIWIRLGYGLRIGQRKAVYGFVCFSVISVFFAYYFHKIGSLENSGIILFVLATINLPVLVSSFRHWGSFK